MKKLKIVIPDKKTISVNDISFERFSQLGEVVEYDLSSADEIAERVKDADIILCNKTPMNESTLHNAKKLKYIGLFATGYNNIDLSYTNSRNITVCNAADYSTYAVAQHTFALILNICSRVNEYNEFVQEGGWVRSDVFSPFVFPTAELFGKTIGIVGFGSIGRTVAQIAKAFGMNVLFCSRTPKDAPDGMVRTDINTLVKNSDFVTVHCPLNIDSERMFNDELFAKFKKGAVFINTARGGVLDEYALVNALENGTLKAAAVDVSDSEPMKSDSPLMGIPNLIVTPHVAWAPPETRERLTGIVFENLKCYLDGCPKNVVL